MNFRKLFKRMVAWAAVAMLVAAIVNIAIMPLSVSAAEYYTPSVPIRMGSGPYTNLIAAGGIHNTNVVRIDVRGWTYANIQVSGQSTTSSTSNSIAALIYGNNDGQYGGGLLITNMQQLYTPKVQCNGTSQVTTNSSFTLGGLAWLYIVSVTNDNAGGGAGIITNYQVTVNLGR